MSRRIIGVTVGTTLSPEAMANKMSSAVVRTDVQQTLDSFQMDMARYNIDAASDRSVIKWDVEQELQPYDMETARRNIGAASNADVMKLEKRIPKAKTYELIETIPIEDGDHLDSVTFYLDNRGESFELTDFVIKVNAGFVDGSQSTLYMNVNGSAVIINGSVPSISTGLRGFNIYFREEPDGFKRVEYTGSMIGTNIYNAQANIARTHLIPPMAGIANLPITSIELSLKNGTTNEFVVGSTFELWGVRA